MANRLIDEDSPYLLQHAHNPVDWYSWSDEAFAKAKEENKLIFLSIGYSSCHWCHVMEKESFENQKIADFLNKNYICIKVDKEERPDIDKHFQYIYQVINRKAGGWPLSVFMSPDRETFYAGTYYPATSEYGMMGFLELTNLLSKKFEQSEDDIKHNAKELNRIINSMQNKKQISEVDQNIVELFIKDTSKDYDSKLGGFSKAPKFPHHATLNTLLDLAKLKKDKSIASMSLDTLKYMAKGGFYDLVDGVFCRYSVDDIWLVPHFEKMCYDNALLIETYLKAYFYSDDIFYKDIATQIADFMCEKMSEDALFYSASDADSNGVEGEYFVYEFDQVEKAIVEAGLDQSLLSKIGFSLDGNFDGKNIVRVEEEFDEWERVKEILKDIRKDKEYPFIDKKIITAQNAMMIKSLFVLARDESRYKNIAINSLDNLLKSMYISEKLYHTKIGNSSAKIEAFLDDYAYMVLALLEAYKTTLDDKYIITAQKMLNSAMQLYYNNGKWSYSIGDFVTDADSVDAATPSAISAILDAMLTISTMMHDLALKELVHKSISYYARDINSYPYAHSSMTNIVARFQNEDKLIKSNEENMHEVVLKVDRYHYPYIVLFVNDDSNYTVCKNSACLNNLENIDLLEI